MNILFLTDNLSEHCGPNVNICLTIANQMIKSNNVYLLTRYDNINPISKTFSDIFTETFSFNADQTGRLIEFTSGEWKNYSVFQKIVKLIKNPLMLRLMVDGMFFEASITRSRYKNELEKICNEKNIDVVIGIVAPYYLAMVVADAKINTKKAIIQLDPYTNIHSLSSKTKRLRLINERITINKLNKVFATEFVIKDIVENKINDEKKLIEIAIPGIRVDDLKKESINSTKEKIDFLYAGQFFEDIRNPEYLLELFKNLPNYYILNIAGNGCEATIEKYKEILGDRLVIHGLLSKYETNSLIDHSDILINLGNSVSNQVPSKIYEYLSTRKPILNIYSLDDCKTIELINDYIKGINISSKQPINDILINEIITFVNDKRKYTIDESFILDKFKKYTDEYVSNRILLELKK